MTLPEIIRDIIPGFLEKMNQEGFYVNGQERHEGAKVWDINNGWCEEFGQEVQEKFAEELTAGNIEGALRGEWLDDEPLMIAHYTLEYEGRFYDSAAPDGVDNVMDLPFFKQLPRPEQ